VPSVWHKHYVQVNKSLFSVAQLPEAVIETHSQVNGKSWVPMKVTTITLDRDPFAPVTHW
jgi:hypothetical protein